MDVDLEANINVREVDMAIDAYECARGGKCVNMLTQIRMN